MENESFATRFNAALRERGLKPSDIVKSTGIGKSAISQYQSGKFEPKQKNIYLIAQALNVSEAWLMGMDVPMERSQPTLSNEGGLTDRQRAYLEKIESLSGDQLKLLDAFMDALSKNYQ